MLYAKTDLIMAANISIMKKGGETLIMTDTIIFFTLSFDSYVIVVHLLTDSVIKFTNLV